MRVSHLLLATAAICIAGVYGPPLPPVDADPIRTDSTRGGFIDLSAQRTSRSVAGGTDLPETFRRPISDVQKSDGIAQATEPTGKMPLDGIEREPQPAPDALPVVDESALRYFAKKGDTARLNAEISRLRTLYPDWVPPSDPLAVAENADADLENMWNLYAQARYPDVRNAMADRAKREPGWTPPADLVSRLAIAEARAALVAASDRKFYADVVRIGADTPSLLTCSEADILWRLAEAFARTGRAARARDAYAYMIDTCTDPAERSATIVKAATFLTPDAVADLVAKEKPGADGKPEFEPLKDDLARRFVAEAGEKPEIVVPPAYLSRMEILADASGLASDSLLVGWYRYRRLQPDAAEPWFRRAHDLDASAVSAQGLALVLASRKDYAGAEAVLSPWQARTTEINALYRASAANLLALDPPADIGADVLQRMASVTLASKDAAPAQQFGWYARRLDQVRTSVEWFATALRWMPGDEASAYGLALGLFDLGDATALEALQGTWASRSVRIGAIGRAPDTRGRVAQQERRRAITHPSEQRVAGSDTAVARRLGKQNRADDVMAKATRSSGRCSASAAPPLVSPAQALMRGWCLMEMERPMEAVGAFEVAIAKGAGKTRADAAYGQSLAYLRLGLSDKAALSTTASAQNSARVVELQTAILSTRAIEAFKIGRFRDAIMILDQRAAIAAERSDLMVLRGYAYVNLNRYADARRIFEAVAATGDRGGVRGLADVKTAMQAGGLGL